MTDAHDRGVTLPISHAILQAHAAEALARLAAVSVISHPGERGMAREEILRRYLRETIPGGFEVTTGFVIDALGGQSRQQDLIIVRKDFHPRFQLGGAQFFPVEAVSAVIEVKSSLNARTIADAIDNVRSVKKLDRTGGGHNYIPAADGSRLMNASTTHDNHLVHGFVVAASCSITSATAVARIRDEMHGTPFQHWINGLAVAGKWFLSYEVPVGEPRSYPSVANGMTLHELGSRGGIEPLVDLAHDLWWWLRASPVLDADPSAYVPVSVGGSASPLPAS